jgi:hypothetical protein
MCGRSRSRDLSCSLALDVDSSIGGSVCPRQVLGLWSPSALAELASRKLVRGDLQSPFEHVLEVAIRHLPGQQGRDPQQPVTALPAEGYLQPVAIGG